MGQLKTKKGYTLIELLLFVALFSIVLIVITGIYTTIFNVKIKTTTVNRVNIEAEQILNLITQTIRDSDGINIPITGASGNTLSLIMPTPAENPTIFQLTGNNITIKRGANSAVLLNSSRIALSSLNFQNLSRPNSNGTMRITLNIQHVNPDNTNVFNYSKIYYVSASVR